MEARLIDLQTQQIVPVDKPVFRIGRETLYVDYCVTNPAVSRCHCNILRQRDGWYILDLDSTNCTYINGIQVPPKQPMTLRHGDEVMLADWKLRFDLIDQRVKGVW